MIFMLGWVQNYETYFDHNTAAIHKWGEIVLCNHNKFFLFHLYLLSRKIENLFIIDIVVRYIHNIYKISINITNFTLLSKSWSTHLPLDKNIHIFLTLLFLSDVDCWWQHYHQRENISNQYLCLLWLLLRCSTHYYFYWVYVCWDLIICYVKYMWSRKNYR